MRGGRFSQGLRGSAELAGATAGGGIGSNLSRLAGPADLDGIVASGGFGVSISPRTAIVGDSLTALSYDQLHPYTWTNGLAGGVLKIVANCGVASDTIQNMINRLDNSYTSGAPGLAGLEPLGWVIVRAGTNNFRNGSGISAGTQAQYIALFNKCLTYADKVIVMAVPPVGVVGSSLGSGIPSVNAWLQSYCDANPSTMKFINDCVNVDNGSGNWVPAYDSADHVHFSSAASCQMGIDGGAVLKEYLSGLYPSPLSTDPADKYPAAPQWVNNHVMAGAPVITGWGVGSYGAGFAASGSRVAADIDDPNQVPWLRVTPTQITATAGAYLSVFTGLSYDTITTSYPDALDVMYEIRFNNFDSSKFRRSRFFVYGNNNEQLNPPIMLWLGNGIRNDRLVARTAVRRSGTRVAHTVATTTWEFQPAETFTGSMGSFDVRCLTIRG